MSAAVRVYSTTLGMLLIAIGGCSSNPTSPEVRDAGDLDPIQREEAISQAPAPTTKPATLSLLSAAKDAATRQDHGNAITYLERAIRIEPRNAALWIELGQQYIANSEYANATQHIRKAIALAAGNSTLTRAAWLAFADLQQATGQDAEAASLRRRWLKSSG